MYNTLKCHLACCASDSRDALLQLSTGVTWHKMLIERTGAAQVMPGVITPPAVTRGRWATVDTLTIFYVELTPAVSQCQFTRSRNAACIYIWNMFHQSTAIRWAKTAHAYNSTAFSINFFVLKKVQDTLVQVILRCSFTCFYLHCLVTLVECRRTSSV